MHNTLQTVEGRLLWSETEAGWCIDANNGASPSLVNPETPISLMAMLSADPIGMVADPDATYTLSAYVKYAVEPGVENEEAYFVDAASYTPGWTTVAVNVPGPRTAWLETGQNIIANVSVGWDDEDMRIRLTVHDYTLGTVPSARTLLWTTVPPSGVTLVSRMSCSTARRPKSTASGTSSEMVRTIPSCSTSYRKPSALTSTTSISP